MGTEALGQGTAVPMVDNGLERRWEMARARTRQVELRQGTTTDGSAGLGHARGKSSGARARDDSGDGGTEAGRGYCSRQGRLL